MFSYVQVHQDLPSPRDLSWDYKLLFRGYLNKMIDPIQLW
jgi:hypothetical protein